MAAPLNLTRDWSLNTQRFFFGVMFLCFSIFVLPQVFANTPAEEAPTTTAGKATNQSPNAALSKSPNSRQVLAPSHVIGQVVIGLLVVTTLIFVLAWFAKRLGYANFQGGAHIKVVASMPLGGREKAVLIEVQGEKILLGVAPGRVNYLQSIMQPEGSPVAVNDEQVSTFKPELKKGQEFARYLKSILEPGRSGSKSNGE